ncbi:MAG: protein phosphatase 2C domain-containing protein [Bacteroidia bacterium]
MKIQISQPQGLNEIGGRAQNEDAIFPASDQSTTADRLFLVCDGVGGANKGEVASRMVVEGFSRFFAQNPPGEPISEGYLIRALRQTEAEMSWHLSQHPECQNMATTLTALCLDEEGAIVGWVGDSRIYQFRGGKCLFKSRDHSLVAELVKQGKITEEEAEHHPRKNVILRAVKGSGGDATDMEIRRLSDVQPGDIFFLCSDGITEQWNDARLSELFGSGIKPDQMIGRIKARSQGNTKDNFSCYVIQIQSTEAETAVVSEKPKTSQIKKFAWIAIGAMILFAAFFMSRKGKPSRDPAPEILAKADSVIRIQQFEKALVWYDSLKRLAPPPEEAILKKAANRSDSIRNIISIEKEKIEDLVGRTEAVLQSKDYISMLNTASALTDFIETNRKNDQIEAKYTSIGNAIKQKENSLNPKEQVSLIVAEMETEFGKNNCPEVKRYLRLAKTKAADDKNALKILSEKEKLVKSCE